MKGETITIFEVAADVPTPASATASAGARPLHARGVQDVIVRATERAVDDVRVNMARFVKSVQEILAEAASTAWQFEIDTVEISAQVSGEGKVGFAGTGINVRGDTGIKFVFKRIDSSS